MTHTREADISDAAAYVLTGLRAILAADANGDLQDLGALPGGDKILIVGRGGAPVLLTLSQVRDAVTFAGDSDAFRATLAPFVKVATAYFDNQLDQARPEWLEKGDDRDALERTDLVLTTDGGILLTFGHVMAAFWVSKRHVSYRPGLESRIACLEELRYATRRTLDGLRSSDPAYEHIEALEKHYDRHGDFLMERLMARAAA